MMKSSYAAAPVVTVVSLIGLLLSIGGCSSRGDHPIYGSKSPPKDTWVLHVGYGSGYATNAEIAPCEVYISDHFQVVGLDLVALVQSEGQREYPNRYANSSYARAGHIKYPGSCVGSVQLPQNPSSKPRWTFDITKYVERNPSGRYFVAFEVPWVPAVEARIEKMSADGTAVSGKTICWYTTGFDSVDSLFEPKGGHFTYAYIEISVPVPLAEAPSR